MCRDILVVFRWILASLEGEPTIAGAFGEPTLEEWLRGRGLETAD